MQVVRNLDLGAWRKFVEGHPRGNIFHTPEMFQAFARAKGYAPSLWATVDCAGQVLALLLPVHITVLGGPLHYLTTRAVVYGGVLCAPGREGVAALAMLLRVYNHAGKRALLFTELRNASDVSELQPMLKENGFVYEEHLNFLIDLTLPLENIRQKIRSNARRNIQKALKSNVVIEEANSPSDVLAAYTILRDVYKRIQVPLPDLSLFQSAFELMHPLGMMQILLAKLNDTNIGALTLLIYKGTLLYWYTGTLREYAQYRAGDLLVWRALELGKQYHCSLFDFGGGGKPDEEYGVRDFKAKFGGELVNFGRNIRVHAPARLKLSEAGYRLLRKFL
jgi:hypothetical protein